ncbi:MAG: hypothetical protein BWZ06_01534 [Bacteroidetes bacterium ADurb.BinA261]|nr:MAG: hypothetical protein BWZ06_01534 [Bacteroidetes bacterium ADurb.BinA261]
MFVSVATIQIRTGFHGHCGSFFRSVHNMMLVWLVKIADRTTIRHNVSLQSPFVAQNVLHILAAAARFTVQTLIGTHHRVNVGFFDRSFEMRQIGFGHIVFVGIHIKRMTNSFWSTVYHKMFRRSHQLQVFRIVALQTFDEWNSHFGSQEGIFAIRFHASSPTRIAKNVDVGCPERQPLINFPLAFRRVIVMFGSRFVGNRCGDIEHFVGIPHGSHPDCLRKDGCQSRTCHAMQAFVPPVVSRNSQSLDCRRIVEHQTHLFFQCQTRKQIGCSFFKCQ